MVYTEIQSRYSNLYIDLIFNTNVMFLGGKSSTGKSFLFDALQELSVSKYPNLICYNYLSKNIEDNLANVNDRLVILDNEEILINDRLRNIINKERNQYLLIGRDTEGIVFRPGCFKILQFENSVLSFKEG